MNVTSRFVYDFGVFRLLQRAKAERKGRRWWHKYPMMLAIYLAATLASMWWSGGLAFARDWTAEAWRVSLMMIAGFGAIFLLAIALIDFLFDRVIMALLFKRYSIADKQVEVTLADDGISTRREGQSGHATWSTVKDLTILRDRSAVALWLGKIEGIVLPAASFSSPLEFDAACALIKEKTRGT